MARVSRAVRIEDAQSKIESTTADIENAQEVLKGAKAEFKKLDGELESWLNNLPETLGTYSKAEELQIAINELQGAFDSCKKAEIWQAFRTSLAD